MKQLNEVLQIEKELNSLLYIAFTEQTIIQEQALQTATVQNKKDRSSPY
ncbi:hypothetical protein [Brevibacillus laterosporus]|nr:hypothetical protein [Brevibacillus laterosporus]MBM7110273.1 hypothetical protein [Brevibacillus laterosporus]MCR8940280.1 hypothetical protein [Brevibacillus laterosporus]MCZ0842919.1 hypothetical protein [Brevibacillus laterosporus]MCZ0846861.1 hypothetical protein [Brevibacillus laterosporus]MED1912565.1 hypothetical protein [Brevibacillus laterosporus]